MKAKRSLVLLGSMLIVTLLAGFHFTAAQVSEEEDEFLDVLFYATPNVVKKQERVLLEWESPDAEYCIASGGWSGRKGAAGAETVKPKKRTVYNIECFDSSGAESEEVSRVVEVVKQKPSQVKLPSVTLRANKKVISDGGTVSLLWKSKNAVACRGYGPDGWTGLKRSSGREVLAPERNAEYIIKCWNRDRKFSDDARVTIEVRELEVKPGYEVYSSNQGFQLPPPGNPPFLEILQQPSPLPFIQQTPLILPPAPVTLSFNSSPKFFKMPGDPIQLIWKAQNAKTCIALGGWSGDRPVEGSEYVKPTEDTTYTIECRNAETNSVTSSSVTVRRAPAPKPVTLSFWTASKTYKDPGEAILLSWRASYATNCFASGGWSGERALEGSEYVRPTDATTYTLECSSPLSNTSQVQSLTIKKYEPPPRKGSISMSFTPAISKIAPSESITLSWSVSNADLCSASGGWSGEKAMSGSEMIKPEKSQTYYLDCKNSTNSRRRSAVIDVVQPGEQKPGYKASNSLALALSRNSAHPSFTVERGKKGQMIGSFQLTNGSSDDYYLDFLNLSDTDYTDALGKVLEKIYVFANGMKDSGGTQIASMGLRTNDSIGLQLAFGSALYLVPGKTTVPFYVYGDVLATASAQNNDDAVSLIVAHERVRGGVGSRSILTQGSFPLQRFTIQGGAPAEKISVLTASLSPTTPVAAKLTSGSKDVTFSDFTLSAGAEGEDITVNRINIISGPPGDDLVNVRLINKATNAVLGTIPTLAGGSVFFDVPLGSLVIPKGSSVTISVKADLRSNTSKIPHQVIGLGAVFVTNEKVEKKFPPAIYGNQMEVEPIAEPVVVGAPSQTAATSTPSLVSPSQETATSTPLSSGTSTAL